MLTIISRFLMFRRLNARMHPGHAYLATVACYPKRHPEGAPWPVVDPAEALHHTQRWEEDPDDEQALIHRLYGTEQDEDVAELRRRGEERTRSR